MSGCWWNPLATRRALYLSVEPSAFRLIRKTHLQPTRFLLGFGGTSFHVPFWMRAVNSMFMAARQVGCLEAVVCENHDPRVKWASKCDPTDNGPTLLIWRLIVHVNGVTTYFNYLDKIRNSTITIIPLYSYLNLYNY